MIAKSTLCCTVRANNMFEGKPLEEEVLPGSYKHIACQHAEPDPRLLGMQIVQVVAVEVGLQLARRLPGAGWIAQPVAEFFTVRGVLGDVAAGSLVLAGLWGPGVKALLY